MNFKDRYISSICLLALLITIVFPIYNILYVYPSFKNLIKTNIEHEAVRIAKHLSTQFIATHTSLNNTKTYNKFINEVEKLKKDFGFIKLKLFLSSGEVIYSTDNKDVGSINKKPYFHNIVAKGNVFTKIVIKEKKSMEGQVMPKDIVETYIPLMNNNRFIGAFEIYYDITEKQNDLNNLTKNTNITLLIVTLSLLVIIATLSINISKALKSEQTARNMLQKALHNAERSEKQLKNLLTNIPDIVFQIDEEGKFTFVNDSIKQFGYDPEELIGKHFKEIIAAEDVDKYSRDKVLSEYKGKATGDSGQPQLIDERRQGIRATRGLELKLKAKGMYKTIISELNSAGIYDMGTSTQEKKFVGSFGVLKTKEYLQGTAGVLRNITKRKNMELALEKSLSLLNATLESTADGILAVDNDGNIITFNKRFTDMWNIPDDIMESLADDKALGYVLEQIKYPDEFIAKVKEIYTHREVKTFDIIEFKDGKIYERHSRPQIIGEEIAGRVWCFRDVTKQKQMELTLKQNYMFLQSLIDSVPNPIFYKDIQGKYLDCNRAFTDFIGKSKREIIGKTVYDMAPKDIADKYYIKDKELFNNPGTQSYEWVVVDSEGQNRNVIFNKATYANTSGKIEGLIGIILDITKLKQLESELMEINKELEEKIQQEIKKRREQEQLIMQQSKLAAMGEMLGAIAHQWRQPLNSLGITIQDVEDAYNFGELDSEYVTSLVENSMAQIQYMSDTIDDFRNFYRPSKNKETFCVIKAINNSIALVSAQLKSNFINISVSTDNGNNHFLVYGYQNEFKQVVLNIINNAKNAIIDARDENFLQNNEGNILLEVTHKPDMVAINIINNGKNISKNILNRIFEPYFTTKNIAEGMGIGLYMSKVIVEKHMNGKVFAKNIEKGVIFTIELPCKQA